MGRVDPAVAAVGPVRDRALGGGGRAGAQGPGAPPDPPLRAGASSGDRVDARHGARADRIPKPLGSLPAVRRAARGLPAFVIGLLRRVALGTAPPWSRRNPAG